MTRKEPGSPIQASLLHCLFHSGKRARHLLETAGGTILASCRFLYVALARCIEMRLLFLFGSLFVAAITFAQAQMASDVADFVSVDTSVFVLDHVRVIDGTGV